MMDSQNLPKFISELKLEFKEDKEKTTTVLLSAQNDMIKMVTQNTKIKKKKANGPLPSTSTSTSSWNTQVNTITYDSVMKKLMSTGVNSRDEYFNTPLHYAAMDGNITAVKWLLSKDAYVSYKNNNLDSALHCAASHGNVEVVQLLLNAGIYIDAKNKSNNTPLLCAVLNNHADVTQLLLNNEAKRDMVNINNKNILDCVNDDKVLKILLDTDRDMVTIRTEKNILHVAIEKNFIDLIDSCIDKGIKAESTTAYGDTALHLATRLNNVKSVHKLLMKCKDIDLLCRDTNGDVALHLAAINGNDQIAELFLERQVHIDTLNRTYQTSLSLAAMSCHKDMVEFLIRRGAIFVDSLKWSPMHYACFNGCKSILEFCLNLGHTINLLNDEDRTYLSLASAAGEDEIVAVLLGRGASVHILDSKKWSPLHYAAFNDRFAVVKLLLNTDIDINALNNYGRTALSLAVENGHTSIVNLLLEHDAKLTGDSLNNTPLHYAVLNQREGILNLLINEDSDLQVKNFGKRTLLSLAAELGCTEIVQMLISRGADLLMIDYDKFLPAHFAVLHGHIAILDMLLVDNTTIDFECIMQQTYRTMLSIAAEMGYIDIVGYLLRRGANKNIEAKSAIDESIPLETKTPLDYAILNMHNDIADILRRPDFDPDHEFEVI